MLGFINASKYEITPHPEDADVIIINTCAFIESAKGRINYDYSSNGSIQARKIQGYYSCWLYG